MARSWMPTIIAAVFPDGRIGSDPSQANIQAGEKIVMAAVKGVISEFKNFAAS